MTDSQPFAAPPRRLSTQSRPASRGMFRDLLTFDRLMTGQLIHLVYWAGLALVALLAFAVVGAAVGSALKGGVQSLLLSLPILVGGLLVVGALGLLWRSFCEFYLTVFRISQDLSAIRAATEAGTPLPRRE